jgi:hypothetical protein
MKNEVASQQIVELSHQDRSEKSFLASRHPYQLAGLLKISLPTSRQPEGAVHPGRTLFRFGDDLCVHFPAKTIVSNHGSLLKQEGYS